MLHVEEFVEFRQVHEAVGPIKPCVEPNCEQDNRERNHPKRVVIDIAVLLEWTCTKQCFQAEVHKCIGGNENKDGKEGVFQFTPNLPVQKFLRRAFADKTVFQNGL